MTFRVIGTISYGFNSQGLGLGLHLLVSLVESIVDTIIESPEQSVF